MIQKRHHVRQLNQLNQDKTDSTSVMPCAFFLFLKLQKIVTKKGNGITLTRLDFFSSDEKLNQFLDVEVRVVARYLKRTKYISVKDSCPKKQDTKNMRRTEDKHRVQSE